MSEDLIRNKIEEAKIEKAYLLLTCYDQVCVGYYQDHQLIFDESRNIDYSLCTKIRVFNKELELRIMKIGDRTISKVITDDANQDVLDEYMYVIGNKIVDRNNQFTIVEQIKRRVELPFKVTEEEVKQGIRLLVRNYLDVDSNGQVIIKDSRLVGFSKNEKEVF